MYLGGCFHWYASVARWSRPIPIEKRIEKLLLKITNGGEVGNDV